MKKVLTTSAFLFFTLTSIAQNVGIGVPNPGAKLEVAGGVKISDSINIGGQVRILSGTPGAGKVLTSDATGVASWQTISPPTYSIGLHPELGGYVFWVSSDGKHGLVAETQDQSNGIQWLNTQDNISNPSNHSTNGQKFRDWRMPTKYELNEMYIQRVAIGGFAGFFYWSSSESNNTFAWVQLFTSNGAQTTWDKLDSNRVRAVRAF